MLADPQTLRVMLAHPPQGAWAGISADCGLVMRVQHDARAGVAAAVGSTPARRGRPPKNPELKGA